MASEVEKATEEDEGWSSDEEVTITTTISNKTQQKDTSGPQAAGTTSATEVATNLVPDIEPRGNKPKPAIISNKSITIQPDTFPPINENQLKECEECHMEFLRSYLYRNFAVDICDDCRDPKQAHELITRTDAKSKYLLKDCDLDMRKPPLRYILKKNPYQSRGDMRLYLKYQIEERALEVHGSEEQLEEELERREELRVTKKQKTYEKKMKSLSMSVRSSLYKKNLDNHEHEFGDPICIDEDKDLYRKECKTCGYKCEYEEM